MKASASFAWDEIEGRLIDHTGSRIFDRYINKHQEVERYPVRKGKWKQQKYGYGKELTKQNRLNDSMIEHV